MAEICYNIVTESNRDIIIVLGSMHSIAINALENLTSQGVSYKRDCRHHDYTFTCQQIIVSCIIDNIIVLTIFSMVVCNIILCCNHCHWWITMVHSKNVNLNLFQLLSALFWSVHAWSSLVRIRQPFHPYSYTTIRKSFGDSGELQVPGPSPHR